MPQPSLEDILRACQQMHDKGIALTERQRGLLLVLPDQPGDGKLCKGPKLRIAENLERLGYAQRVGSGFFNGGKFTRTAAGRAKLVELGDLVGLPGLRVERRCNSTST